MSFSPWILSQLEYDLTAFTWEITLLDCLHIYRSRAPTYWLVTTRALLFAGDYLRTITTCYCFWQTDADCEDTDWEWFSFSKNFYSAATMKARQFSGKHEHSMSSTTWIIINRNNLWHFSKQPRFRTTSWRKRKYIFNFDFYFYFQLLCLSHPSGHFKSLTYCYGFSSQIITVLKLVINIAQRCRKGAKHCIGVVYHTFWKEWNK